MRADGGLTRKGDLRANAILGAALRCLARDGFAATSLQRVADEAGTSKRAVVYYYGSREGLFTHVAQQVGDRLVDRLGEAVNGLETPEEIVDGSFRALWEAITTDRPLLIAWFGLHAESITNTKLQEAAGSITNRLIELIGRLVDRLILRGYTLRVDRDIVETLTLVSIQGLALAYLDFGNTQRLRDATAAVQSLLTSVIVLAHATAVDRGGRDRDRA